MSGRKPAVLIVSNSGDVHVPLVSRRLEALGVDHVLLDTFTFGTTTTANFEIGARTGIELKVGTRRISFDEITAVWYRRPEMPRVSEAWSREAQTFAQQEQKAFLDGILTQLTCRWVSPIQAIRHAGNRPVQLSEARRLGFTVPTTLISQDPARIQRFRQAVGVPLVAKVVGKGPPRAETIEGQYVVFTQKLDDKVLDDQATLAACVALYQPYVHKKFELRVTVVGDEVFACRIDSQNSVKTRVDWRNYDLKNPPHSAYELDGSTRQRCLELV